MKLRNLFVLPILAVSMLVGGCKKNTPVEPEPVDPTPVEPTKTEEAKAIDEVAALISIALEETIEAIHNNQGDFISLNFGTTPTETLKSYSTAYFIPEGFEAVTEWTADTFSDGVPVEYVDYVRNETALEYAVFTVDSYTGEEEVYNGNYLQISAFSIAE